MYDETNWLSKAPRWKFWLAKIFGTEFRGRDSSDKGVRYIRGYTFRGVTYITDSFWIKEVT